MLGADDRDERPTLLFTRQLGADGVVAGPLAQAFNAAGIPKTVALEILVAFGTVLQLERDLRDGDRFHVRWEQSFTLDNEPTGVPRTVSAELRTARRGIVVLSRFRPVDARFGGGARLFLGTGHEAGPPPLRLPLDKVHITSGFGLRPDPLDQPQRRAPVVVPPSTTAEAPAAPPRTEEDRKEIARAYAGFAGSSLGQARDVGGRNAELDRIMAERRVRAREQEDARRRAAEAAATAPPPPAPEPRRPTVLFMHEGVDLLAAAGTPVRAAGGGRVIGAGPNRGYGIWVRIEHASGMSSVYAHLQGIAPGIERGTVVARGDVIGFVGSTGRSTGAHLHFEVLDAGRAVDPQAATQPRRLGTFDLARLRRQLAAEKAERDRKPPPPAVATRAAAGAVGD